MLGAFTYTLELQSEETPEADRLKDTVGLTEQQLGAVHVIESRGGKVIRAPGGPVTELRLTFARNQETKNKPSGMSTRIQLHDSASLAVSVEAFPELNVLDVFECGDSFISDAGHENDRRVEAPEEVGPRRYSCVDKGVAALQKSLPECEILCRPASIRSARDSPVTGGPSSA